MTYSIGFFCLTNSPNPTDTQFNQDDGTLKCLAFLLWTLLHWLITYQNSWQLFFCLWINRLVVSALLATVDLSAWNDSCGFQILPACQPAKLAPWAGGRQSLRLTFQCQLTHLKARILWRGSWMRFWWPHTWYCAKGQRLRLKLHMPSQSIIRVMGKTCWLVSLNHPLLYIFNT